MDSELYLKQVLQRKANVRPRPPSAPLVRKSTKTRRRPYSAHRQKKQHVQKHGNLASASRRGERKYNFFSLNILGRQNKLKQTKRHGISTRRMVVSQHPTFGTKSHRSYKTNYKNEIQINDRVETAQATSSHIHYCKESKRSLAVQDYKGLRENSGPQPQERKQSVEKNREKSMVNNSVLQPTEKLIKSLNEAGLTQKMIDEDRYERDKPSLSHLKFLFHRWMYDNDIDRNSFSSFAVFCEYKLRQGLTSTEHYEGTNRLRTSIVGMCIDRACKEIHNYCGFLTVFAEEFLKAVYVDWEHVKQELHRDGRPSDGEKLFHARTYYEEYERVKVENMIYTLKVNDFMEIQQNITRELNDRKMVTSLGVVKRHFDSMKSFNLASFRRSKEIDNVVEEAKQKIEKTRKKYDKDTSKKNRNEIGDLASILDKIRPDDVAKIVLDIGMSYSQQVSTDVVLSPLFNAMCPLQRQIFLSNASRSLSENEQKLWLESISIGKRDNGFRYVLKKILNNESIEIVTSLLRGDDENQKLLDRRLLQDVWSLKSSANNNDAELHRKFVNILCGMLHEYVENAAPANAANNNSDQNEINEIIASGMSKIFDASKFSLGTIHEAIQIKVQEIIRYGEVANEQRILLKDEVVRLKNAISKMEKEMGENARIKNDMRKIEEYGGSFESLHPIVSNNSLATSLQENEPYNDEKFAKDKFGKSNHSRSFIEDTQSTNTSDKMINRSSLRKQERVRRQSFVGMLQDDAKEAIMLRHNKQKSAAVSHNKAALQNIEHDLPLLSKPKEKLSLVECNLIIADIYQEKLISNSRCDRSFRQRISLADHTRYFFVKQLGSRCLAIQNSNMLHNSIIQYSPNNFRCRLFGLLIGSVEPSSYLNRVEATDFLLRALLTVFEVREKDLRYANQLPISIKDLMGDGLESSEIRKSSCFVQQEKAAQVVREMFRNDNVSTFLLP